MSADSKVKSKAKDAVAEAAAFPAFDFVPLKGWRAGLRELISVIVLAVILSSTALAMAGTWEFIVVKNVIERAFSSIAIILVGGSLSVLSLMTFATLSAKY